MKRFAFAVLLFLAQGLVAQASPDMTYDHLPDSTHKLVRLGSRWVIQDARGFFVGYYVAPRPKPQPYTPSYPSPQARRLAGSNSFQNSSFGSPSGFNSFNNGYGYNGFGFNTGFGFNNGFGCNNGYRFNRGFNSGFNSCNRPQPQFREQPRTRAMVPVR